MRAGDALRLAADRLASAGIEDARREARLLLSESAHLSLALLVTERDTDIDVVPFEALVSRRMAREPMAMILGFQEFWSLRFAVSRDTLVPRADSETLIAAALGSARDVRRVLDLGIGTGCLLLAALSEFPGAWGLGIDASAGAARLARQNSRNLSFDDRSSIVCADWYSALQPGRGALRDGSPARFDLILCNPPYIPHGDVPALMPEVSTFEPSRALDGGADGLEAYRRVLPQLPGLLNPSGIAVFELGQHQEMAVADIAKAAGLAVRTVRPDLGGVPRAIVLAQE